MAYPIDELQPEAFITSTDARQAGQSLEELERAAKEANAATQTALRSYMAGELSESGLEGVVRAEAEARYQVQLVKQRGELDKTVAQLMNMARQKFRETASLRDPRPFVRGQG